ncbi:metallophosphoesterase [Chloroflexi bacterium TSY]|nr:metallophosphoesterase [Chloroflexi bacterium TSY]
MSPAGGGGFAMSPEAFYDTLAQTQNQFRQLFAQTYAIPGNHDCPPGGGDWSHFEQLWGLQSGQGCTIDLPMARLVLLNTHGHSPQQIEESKPSDPIYGWVNETELARLDDALKTAGVRPVLLFMHQCLHPPTNPFLWQDFFQLRQKSGTKNDHKG